MGIALIRLEDIGPGGHYESAEQRAKLLVVADYLSASGIPFQAAVISRFVDPGRGVDRSIESPADPAAADFVRTLHSLARRGASLGMHGYTHQYGNAVSGEGYEFTYPGCRQDCPPDDDPKAWRDRDALRRTYAFGRFARAASAFRAAGLRPDWFETPHYAVSIVQRGILDACSSVMYETNPDQPDSRRITVRPSRSAWGRTFYVPTPLGYVGGSAVDEDTDRIIREAGRYGGNDLASFFYHPFLEFPFIRWRPGGRPIYAESSPLHRIVKAFASLGRRFVSLPGLLGTAGKRRFGHRVR